MAIKSIDKGKRFERELAALFREHGFTDARRTAQYCGNTGDASDVVGLPNIHIEAKHVEQMRLYEWIEQAKRDSAGTGNLPAVFHKKNRAEILVTMPFDDWMEMYKRCDWDDKMDYDDDICYECGGYGDDYSVDENGELISNCIDCPNNPANRED